MLITYFLLNGMFWLGLKCFDLLPPSSISEFLQTLWYDLIVVLWQPQEPPSWVTIGTELHACRYWNRKPCNTYFMVNNASGMDCGQVCPGTPTTTLLHMAAILHIIGFFYWGMPSICNTGINLSFFALNVFRQNARPMVFWQLLKSLMLRMKVSWMILW